MTVRAAEDSSAVRLFVIAAAFAALVFAFVTPPFKVPDEVGHFWRASAIAYGVVVPQVDSRGASAEIPVGLKTLVFILYSSPSESLQQQKVTAEKVRLARQLPLEQLKMVSVTFPAGYTPVPYTGQIVASLAGRATHAKPVVTFYLGRLLNALLYIVLIATAIRVTPLLRWLFCAAGLLPMAMYLAGSWSPDAMTIAASFLFLALLLRACSSTGPLRGREVAALACAAALVGLCKPAYFLIALLVTAIPASRSRRRGAVIALVLVVTAAATGVSLWTSTHGGGSVRPDAVVDAGAQLDCIRRAPLQFVAVVTKEFRVHAGEYVGQCIGRLGMMDAPLPRPVIWIEVFALGVAAASAGGAIRWNLRLLAMAIAAATAAGIAASLYIGWTPPCAGSIDGIQGRYFLPILPTVGLALGGSALRGRNISLVTTPLAAAIAAAASVATLIIRYYS